jgi:hypothetical protein
MKSIYVVDLQISEVKEEIRGYISQYSAHLSANTIAIAKTLTE